MVTHQCSGGGDAALVKGRIITYGGASITSCTEQAYRPIAGRMADANYEAGTKAI